MTEVIATTSDVEAATTDDVVKVLTELPKSEYETLIAGARDAGLSPERFLKKAIADEAYLARQRRRGYRIFVQTPGGLRELVD